MPGPLPALSGAEFGALGYWSVSWNFHFCFSSLSASLRIESKSGQEHRNTAQRQTRYHIRPQFRLGASEIWVEHSLCNRGPVCNIVCLEFKDGELSEVLILQDCRGVHDLFPTFFLEIWLKYCELAFPSPSAGELALSLNMATSLQWSVSVLFTELTGLLLVPLCPCSIYFMVPSTLVFRTMTAFSDTGDKLWEPQLSPVISVFWPWRPREARRRPFPQSHPDQARKFLACFRGRLDTGDVLWILHLCQPFLAGSFTYTSKQNILCSLYFLTNCFSPSYFYYIWLLSFKFFLIQINELVMLTLAALLSWTRLQVLGELWA